MDLGHSQASQDLLSEFSHGGELTATTNFVPAAFAFRVGVDLSFLGEKICSSRYVPKK